MTWDQIELKWAEMTNRVRADVAMPAKFQGPGTSKAPSTVKASLARIDYLTEAPKLVPAA